MLDHLLTDTRRLSSPPARAHRPVEFVVRPIMVVLRWIEFHAQREQLAELEDHQLSDLGLSAAQVRKECSKWPWQA
jgi:uncharacterized protein YjiS (DUF1127 family)